MTRWKTLALIGLSFVAHATFGYAWPQQPVKVLVTLSDLKNNDDLFLRSLCQKVYQIGNRWNMTKPVHVTCDKYSSKSFVSSIPRGELLKYDWRLRIDRVTQGYYVDMTKLHRQLNSDPQTLSVKIAPKSEIPDSSQTRDSQKILVEATLERVLHNFFLYLTHEQEFKAALLYHGIEESSEVSFDRQDHVFRHKFTGEALELSQALSIYENESPRKANYLRASIEMGILLSAGLALYYKNLVYNRQDFDYGLTDGLKKKFITGEAVRFDDNDKWANVGHEFAGMLYYQAARTNGANPLESFLITFGASALWEVLEYHEVFSINDQIMTSVAGYTLGEALYQTSCALLQKNSLAKTLGYSISPILGLNHQLDKRKHKNKYNAQSDCAKPRWSEISLHLGLEKNQKPYVPSSQEIQHLFVALNSEVITIPNYNKPGETYGFVYPSPLTKLQVELNSPYGGPIDLRFIAQVVGAAYHQKKLRENENGSLSGYEFILGLGTATTWNDRGLKTENLSGSNDPKEEYFGTINILGPVAHVVLYHKGFRIKAEFGFYADFVMVKSYALETFVNENGVASEQLPNELRKRGHYYGTGTTLLSAISLEYDRWRFMISGQDSKAQSINGLSRGQTDTTRDDIYRDQYSFARITIAYQLTKNLRLEIFREIIHRLGSVNERFERKGREDRINAALVYLF